MRELTVDPEFAALIPALSPEEREQLETNLIADGIREPLSVWGGILIDGHNRYEIAKKFELDFDIKEYEFGSRQEAMCWIVRNQLGRRNLSLWDRSKLALKLKPSLKGETPDTREAAAKAAGVSGNTISRAEYIENNASEETKERLDRGEITINKAYTEIKPREALSFEEFKEFCSDEDAKERAAEILEKLPVKESKLGLPYQKKASLCIGNIADGSLGAAIGNILELLDEPSPATIALARILLEAILNTN